MKATHTTTSSANSTYSRTKGNSSARVSPFKDYEKHSTIICPLCLPLFIPAYPSLPFLCLPFLPLYHCSPILAPSLLELRVSGYHYSHTLAFCLFFCSSLLMQLYPPCACLLTPLCSAVCLAKHIPKQVAFKKQMLLGYVNGKAQHGTLGLLVSGPL